MTTTIEQRIPLTLELATLSLLLAILIGVPAGVIAASRRGKASDYGDDRHGGARRTRCRTSGSACC